MELSAVPISRILSDNNTYSINMSDTIENKQSDTKLPLLSNPDESEPLISKSPSTSDSFFDKFSCFNNSNKFQKDRTIQFLYGTPITQPLSRSSYPRNVIRNQKYSILTFFPIVLFNQFKFFFNFYYLITAMSQFIDILAVGFLFTYVAPLAFVLSVTMMKEAYDDFQRYRRDQEANSQLYQRLTKSDNGTAKIETIPSSQITVGDIILLKGNQRVPADLLLLKTVGEDSGTVFVRTDQLDGETDWKLRHAIPSTQKLENVDCLVTSLQAEVVFQPPTKEIYNFAGTYTSYAYSQASPNLSSSSSNLNPNADPLTIDNTLWCNTVIASSNTNIACLVIYTGADTRIVMNTSLPASKIGQLDLELNFLSKVLFFLMVVMAFIITIMRGFSGTWYIYFFRFILLLSSIIPISLRVNLDMGKTVYSYFIHKDKDISGTVVRNSMIPEELGRIQYLFSDKTGTLTQNIMTFKKLQLVPPFSLDRAGINECKNLLEGFFTGNEILPINNSINTADSTKQSILINNSSNGHILSRAVISIALCHNVTPVYDDSGEFSDFQAASPDEIALVKFAQSVGVTLLQRDDNSMKLQLASIEHNYEILDIFPFTSERKRMGIIIRDNSTDEIMFIIKGAESVIKTMLLPCEWLEEEVDNLAREGLRTLVFTMKSLSREEYQDFNKRISLARTIIRNRDMQIAAVLRSLETDLEIIGVTGVEDQLQQDVIPSLETLRNAGVKVWMLTGDKAETAHCIGISTHLIDRNQEVVQILAKTKAECARRLDVLGARPGAAIIIDGTSLTFCLQDFKEQFFELASEASAVICCRCSPTQKQDIVLLHKKYRTCAIGDGGNDVSMIQSAHVGIGLVGKEGMQASLAADFSLTQFSHITQLLLWHGRNSYMRSARLSQFVMHRGLVISVIQFIFSSLFFYASIPIYSGYLLVGYATIFTMFPVFSLVLDHDITISTAFMFPELYKNLHKGRVLCMKTFLFWVGKSVFQGGMIMLLAMWLFEDNFLSIVIITFTALILAELLNIALMIESWHWLIVAAEFISLIVYVLSIFILKDQFDAAFLISRDFFWKVAVITGATCLPFNFGKALARKLNPPSFIKLRSSDSSEASIFTQYV